MKIAKNDQFGCPVVAILDLAAAIISQVLPLFFFQIIRSNERVYQVSHFYPNVQI